ncbi:hypothetical protein [Spirosoma pollinicola]|uniref:Uncharacterized protein n=1 Tax=Spirosoma pollinicola TaxID=2057025 RepID=A0A2K8ZAW9_9BACT|nr:hypothetical protein [Spirosoma pollinicola]AUD06995.1 hypothetical protein CWM47_37360 [Spirosoma pollinicola]
MSTEQSYPGKGGNATQTSTNGLSIEQTANKAPLTASHPDLSDAEFINALQAEYNLSVEDRETITGLLLRSYPRDLVERTAKRFGDTPGFQSVVNQVADVKQQGNTTKATRPIPKPNGDLVAPLEILVNARFGTSHADVLIFALAEYQESRLKEAFESLDEEEYHNAANSLSDSQGAGQMLMELALSLSKLADRNYWAISGETPEGKGKSSDLFESYAKHYFGFSAERIQEYIDQSY